jgi:formylglycine-generating enzyme required for sulfatase activity
MCLKRISNASVALLVVALSSLAADKAAGPREYDAEYRDACGPIAAFMACEYYGIPARLEEMLALTKTESGSGTTLLALKAGLQKKGLQCQGITIDPNDLSALTNTTFILPTAEQGEGYDHFVFGVNRCGFVALCDFDRHIEFPNVEKLEKKWHGELLLISNEESEGGVRQAEKTLAVNSGTVYVGGIPFVWIGPGEWTTHNGEKALVDRGFYMSQYEFPNLALLRFVTETRFGLRDGTACEDGWVGKITHIKKEDMFRPVTCVTGETAKRVASWFAPDAAVPTYSQWMLAFQGGKGGRYPWGESEEPLEGFAPRDRIGLIGENQRDVTDAGVYDMFGNAIEIVDGGQVETFRPTNEADMLNCLQYTVVLGTGWHDEVTASAAPPYKVLTAKMWANNVGFRLVLNRERVDSGAVK